MREWYNYAKYFFKVDMEGRVCHHIIPAGKHSYNSFFVSSIVNLYPLDKELHLRESKFFHYLCDSSKDFPSKAKLPFHNYNNFRFLDLNKFICAPVLTYTDELYLTGKRSELLIAKRNFLEKGIGFYPIYVDELISPTKREIIYSMLRNRISSIFPDIYKYTGISFKRYFARKGKLSIISMEEADIFYELNHIQGKVRAKYNFGLFIEDVLVSCMSFDNHFSNKLELVRLASLINSVVVGGASKLFKFACNTLPKGEIVSYADLRFTKTLSYTDTVYNTLGFDFVSMVRPCMYYKEQNGVSRYSRYSFKKNKLKLLFPEIYNSSLTEKEIMKGAGYKQIFDCGKLKFIFRRN